MQQSEATKRPKSKLNRLHVILIALALISVLATGVTFSSYKSTADGGDSVKVALFASTYKFDVPITGDYYPGVTREVPITICNYDGDKVCEVSQSYALSYEVMLGRLPLQISIKDDMASSGEFLVSGGKQSAQLTLVIHWPSDDNDYLYADEIDVVRVTIDATQIN